LDIRGNIGEKADGGYLRGSWDLGENFYLLGGYTAAKKSWTERDSGLVSISGTIYPVDFREKNTVDVNQIEFGFGGYFQLSPNLDFYGDLTAIRLEGKERYRETASVPSLGISGTIDSYSEKDHIYAGKLMAGLRVKPTASLELWGRAGYIRLEEESGLLRRSSAVGNVGAQLQITPNFGLVGEAELYKDLRLYRAGLRLSF